MLENNSLFLVSSFLSLGIFIAIAIGQFAWENKLDQHKKRLRRLKSPPQKPLNPLVRLKKKADILIYFTGRKYLRFISYLAVAYSFIYLGFAKNFLSFPQRHLVGLAMVLFWFLSQEKIITRIFSIIKNSSMPIIFKFITTAFVLTYYHSEASSYILKTTESSSLYFQTSEYFITLILFCYAIAKAISITAIAMGFYSLFRGSLRGTPLALASFLPLLILGMLVINYAENTKITTIDWAMELSFSENKNNKNQRICLNLDKHSNINKIDSNKAVIIFRNNQGIHYKNFYCDQIIYK